MGVVEGLVEEEGCCCVEEVVPGAVVVEGCWGGASIFMAFDSWGLWGRGVLVFRYVDVPLHRE